MDALDEALSIVRKPTHVLDACGGSGNVSSILTRRGVVPTVVDVSSEMLARWEQKAAGMGLSPEIHVAPIEQFLQGDDRCWDLIVFSSALHHLEHPGVVLATAAWRLSEGGAIVTIYDPTSATRALRLLRMVDWIGHLLIHQPREFVAVARRWSRRRRDEKTAADTPHVGRLAERHALDGIDDLQLRRTLEAVGLEVIVHERSYEARLWIVRTALRVLGSPSSFRFLVRRHAVGG